jgi:hypothetical protein
MLVSQQEIKFYDRYTENLSAIVTLHMGHSCTVVEHLLQQTMWRQGKKTISRFVSKQMQHSRRSSSAESLPDGG